MLWGQSVRWLYALYSFRFRQRRIYSNLHRQDMKTASVCKALMLFFLLEKYAGRELQKI